MNRKYKIIYREYFFRSFKLIIIDGIKHIKFKYFAIEFRGK